jgi:4'-phosphopantetheinyl transferase
MVELYAFNITSSTAKERYEEYLESVGEQIKKEILKYKFEADRMRTLYGKIMLQELLVKKFHLRKEELNIERTSYGKPYIANLNNIHFNISHSGDWVLCGVGEKELGVDIEHFGKYHKDIVERYFTAQEIYYLESLTEIEKQRYFYFLWSLKESFLKCKGKGLSMPLNSISFHLYLKDVIAQSTTNLIEGYRFRCFYDVLGYSVAVCSTKEEVFPILYHFELN